VLRVRHDSEVTEVYKCKQNDEVRSHIRIEFHLKRRERKWSPFLLLVPRPILRLLRPTSYAPSC